ncbi:MAG: hypothetical protein KGI04_04660 [Candidatus Micrarchaeota archaeon]|nr:hypothetical protein [Candidatus Micrarchaeota archaeon]
MFGRLRDRREIASVEDALKAASSLSEETKKALWERIEKLIRKDSTFGEWLNAK